MSKKIILILISTLLISSISFAQQITDTSNRTDKAGKKQGYWKKTDAKGILKYEGNFKDNYPTGEFKYYYEDGKIKAISKFFEKGIRSYSKTYYPNGKLMSEGFYISTHKDSTWKYYNEFDVLIKEESYKANLKNGEWKTFYDDASLFNKISWKNGKREGSWEQNYSSGSLKTQYKNDKLEGLYQEFTPDGKLKSQGKYKNNLKEGLWFWYNHNGSTIKKHTYKNDKLIGKELIVNENGKAIGINIDSIAYVYSSEGNTFVRKLNSELRKINQKFTETIEVLGLDNFLRINKNFLANYSALKGILPFNGGLYKVQLSIQPDFDVISEEESSKALKTIFPDNK
ncbi:MAG: LytTR family transcriptional regulator DNA-binding domain-containing protein [Bacteroidales bacterium]